MISFKLSPTIFLLFALFLISCSSKQQKEQSANSASTGTIQVTDGWARPAAKGANSAVYLTIRNDTEEVDTLLGVSVDIAQMSEVHESYEEDGMMAMRPAGKQAIKSGAELSLKPGGFHIMLMQMKQPLSEGDSLKIILEFSRSGRQSVSVPVRIQ